MEYEFTITLRPTMYKFNATKQFELSWRIIRDRLQDIEKVSCVADLTKAHNIHYHCIIDLPNRKAIDKLLNKFRGSQIIGSLHVSQLINNTKWKNYMSEKVKPTKDIITQSPVIRDYYGILGEKEYKKFEGD